MELLREFGEPGGSDDAVMATDLRRDREFRFGSKFVGTWREVAERVPSCDVLRLGIASAIDRTACHWNNVDKFVTSTRMFGAGCADGELFASSGLRFTSSVDSSCFGFASSFDSATIGATIGT